MTQKSNEPNESLKTAIHCLGTLLTSLTTPTSKKSVFEAVDVNEPKAVGRLKIRDLV